MATPANSTPAPADNVLAFPTSRREPYRSPALNCLETIPDNVSPALIDRANAVYREAMAREPRRGVGMGRRDFSPTIANSSREWRAAAKEVWAAGEKLNLLLPAEGWERNRAPGDHADPDSPELAEAFTAYRKALCGLIECKSAKPRHVVDILRATAELMDMQDPIWAYMDVKASRAEQVFACAVNRIRYIIEP